MNYQTPEAESTRVMRQYRGPWQRVKDDFVLNADGNEVCCTYDEPTNGDPGILDKRKNADLIAAAPEMLDILKKEIDLLSSLRSFVSDDLRDAFDSRILFLLSFMNRF